MTRIFVGNLPTDILDKDVENEFSSYGTVNKVEVKHKTDPLTNDIMSTFAYVTMRITDDLLNQCLQEFKNEQFRGRYLIVSVARENFMDKLKREREESTQSTQSPSNNTKPVIENPVVNINPFRLNANTNAKVIKTFNSDDEEESNNYPTSIDSSFTEADSIIKRKSKLFTENGKIKIPSFNGCDAVVQPMKKIERKTFDEKSEKADRKRVESLMNMKNTYNQQKLAVKQALSNVESTKNKKIIFDEPKSEFVGKATQKSKPLFDDDADDDSFDYGKSFEIKKQYEGEQGARLQKLQSRFQNDQRFKMNENFLDGNDEAEENEMEVEEAAADASTDERKWQYDMLESVMGKKFQPEAKKKSDHQMLRYDPTKNDHEKYEKVLKRKARNSEKDSEPAKQMKLNEDNEFQVSKEQFFNVTSQLNSALKPTSEGFSLLSMFGRDNDIVEAKPKNPYQEITLSKGQQNIVQSSSSMFRDDSSDDEIVEERLTKTPSRPVSESKQKNTKKNSKAEIWHEPFFIFGSDQRLLDGLSLFLPSSSDGVVAEDFENKQKAMRTIIKRKIKKSIRRVLPRGAKPNKRFGRLVKDMA